MNFKGRKVLLCNCERSMEIDGKALAGTLGGDAAARIHSNLCRMEVQSFTQTLDTSDNILVACTQERPLFNELAQEQGFRGKLAFTNIRERAGWCDASAKSGAKIAALLAEATLDVKAAGTRTLESQGVCLVYGSGQIALDVARRLAARLNVSLLFKDAADAIPPAIGDVPIYQGRIVRASGHLGAFEITVDGYAPASPSSRRTFTFLLPRDGANSTCDIIFDLSGGSPLFIGHDKRDGYFHVDPNYPAGIAEAILAASDMVGSFEKPIYVNYDADICAHGRNRKTGCSNCLDACPAGAISSTGDIVAIDSGICGGCGSCSASCPTGAVSYAYPQREDLIPRIQTLLSTYLTAGGKTPVLLVHDESHGADLISAIARFGRGLPVNVLPLSVFTPGQFGHEALTAALVEGAQRVLLLLDPQRRDEFSALEREAALTRAFLTGLGFENAASRLVVVTESDPDRLEAVLYEPMSLPPIKAATFQAVGGKREIARSALAKLHEIAPRPANLIALPAQAPYGTIHIDTAGCTLCLACVSACPADALHDNPERPEVRFVEAACVQCGLCAKTCPEQVITLEPRYDFTAQPRNARVLHFEEPFHCISCGKPFGTKSTIDRISAKLAGKHSMFQTQAAQELIKMCDNCRVVAQANSVENPFAAGERPRVRTTDDYLSARERAIANGGALSVDDFLLDDE